ncbi:putative cation-transporting ATPase W08D2.5, partial [Pseudolycoriella hygida]
MFPFGRRAQSLQKKDIENIEQTSELLKETNPKSSHAILNQGEDDEMVIIGYQRSLVKTVICWFGFIVTLGLLRLVMHWWKHWFLIATHESCPLEYAKKVLVSEHYEGKHTIHYVKDVITLNADTMKAMQLEREKWVDLVPLESSTDDLPANLSIHFQGGIFKTLDSIRIFKCKQLRYIWDSQTNSFVKLKGLDHNVSSVVLHQQKGLSKQDQYGRRLAYGYNKISIPLYTVWKLLFLEMLNPFYVFQVFSVCLWFAYNYYYYAAVIVLMSGFGVIMSIIQTRKNQVALYSTVMNTDSANVVDGDGKTKLVETKYLVPGDILDIPSSGCTMTCDAVLLSGNCILDESMLTGESVPVTKTPLPCRRDLMFDPKEHARHVLFSGTKVIQTRYIGTEKVLAVIINTGNITAKGGLVRSILYPPPVDYKFEQDSYKFIMLLALIAGFGFVYTLVTKIMRGVPGRKIAIESLDLITIAVPPALPAAMSVGRLYAQRRLEKMNIYCISPRSINVAGSIDCVCFDKTGTLTEDGMDMWGVVPKTSTNYFQIPLREVDRLPYDHFLFGMVTCHSITIMNGELKGDPLDLKMFESTGWLLEEANVSDDTKYDLLFPTTVKPPKDAKFTVNNSENDDGTINSMDIGIVREFAFTSSLQRMSVVTRKLMDKNFNVYCKGSPEMILTLCKLDTIPIDFHSKLDEFAQQGYRIIAVAHKPLNPKMTYAKVQRVSREKIECDLEFQGFVVLENRLKADTISIIGSLQAANIRTIMVTGDNILTALSVARDCDMITKGQSVITVNARPHPTKPDTYELFYNLNGTRPVMLPFAVNMSDGDLGDGAATIGCNSIAQTPNGYGGDYCLMTNSNSVASLEMDTCTQTTNVTQRDVEGGYKEKNIDAYDDEDPLELVPELPSNNYRFAMTGETWAIIRDYFPDLLPKFVTRGTVFARMSPEQKQSLVLELQAVGYYVAMCGDGANDCGALKAAHTGISLSEAESSVASPFTSKSPTIACVPNIIKQGRAALVTSVGIFKYMAAYSLIQFLSVLLLYSIDSNLTDIQFLYIDLFMISVFAFFFGRTEAYDGPLVKQTPLSSLVSLSPVASLILHLLLVVAFQVGGWFHLQAQEWFVPFTFHGEKKNACWENYTTFSISSFQYATLAFIFSKGKPYRKSIVTNYGFMTAILVNVAFCIWLILDPPDFLISAFELIMPPDKTFRVYIIFYGIANFFLSLFVEEIIIEKLFMRRFRYRFHNIEKSRRKYLAIENYLRQHPSWPPLSLYQNYLPTTEKDMSVQGQTFAEIYVETGVDNELPFDQNNKKTATILTKTECCLSDCMDFSKKVFNVVNYGLNQQITLQFISFYI